MGLNCLSKCGPGLVPDAYGANSAVLIEGLHNAVRTYALNDFAQLLGFLLYEAV